MSSLTHGGRLQQAVQRYGILRSAWLDLSTGINPHAWQVPSLPPEVWARLPEDDDELLTSAATYYGSHALLPVAGSQAAIQALPYLRPVCCVGVLHPCYNEHAHAWQSAGHRVQRLAVSAIASAVAQLDVLVLVNPNNPTGVTFTTTQLHTWHAQLATHGGWLVVDEAFMDVTPEASLITTHPHTGLIVLRSLGKFFGLAGARVGFVWTEATLLQALQNRLGPWAVNAPARWVARQALQDTDWQQAMRLCLQNECMRLHALLTQHGLTPDGGCALFQWVVTPQAEMLHEQLAQRGILTRLFTEPLSIRLGLPAKEEDWVRLETALVEIKNMKINVSY